jgi:protein TonB
MAAIPAAPTQGRLVPTNSNVVPTWKTQIVALLERNKRYPETAQSRREQGVAQVFFSLDRQGRVLESRVVRSSGANALDEEALALLRRAQPFPPPPRELAGDHIDLTVPIRFNLK